MQTMVDGGALQMCLNMMARSESPSMREAAEALSKTAVREMQRDIAAKCKEVSDLRREFNAVIKYAIECDSPDLFLKTWSEGDSETLNREWPEFVQPNA